MTKLKTTIALLFVFIFTLNSTLSFADAKGKTKTYVPNFVEGRTVTQADVTFLTSISDPKDKAENKKSVKVEGHEVTVGTKFTAATAAAATKVKSNFTMSHKLDKVSKEEEAKAKKDYKGDGEWCPYGVCTYCDIYGRCWYVCC